MMKITHRVVAVSLIIPIVIKEPLSLVGLWGATAPDWDFYFGIKHRGFTHSILALLLSSALIYVIDKPIALVWFISYLSHIVLDSFTITGVPYFYPFLKKKIKLGKIRTGSAEDMFILLLAIAFICFVYLE